MLRPAVVAAHLSIKEWVKLCATIDRDLGKKQGSRFDVLTIRRDDKTLLVEIEMDGVGRQSINL